MNAIRQALTVQFFDELSALEGKPYESIQLDSVYAGLTGIAGTPLNDNNLGQTLINNYGRPYQSGFNNSTGFSARADDGRFSYYVSGEYQHSQSAPPYPRSARLTIAAVNNTPLQPATPFAEINQFRLLDTHVSTKLLGPDISIGKQSLDWGPSESGSMVAQLKTALASRETEARVAAMAELRPGKDDERGEQHNCDDDCAADGEPSGDEARVAEATTVR
jgi:hypothetical protein